MSRRGWSRRETVVEVSGPLQLQRAFKAYYSLYPPIEEPRDIAYREFAFQLFKDDVYVRHMSFESLESLARYLAEEAPKNAYYSVARYQLPDAPKMEEKVWLGSELMFDLDVDHLPGCGEAVADDCILAGYRYASLLVKMLYRDFGVPSTMYFTGNRGFHVIADCEWCRGLTREERREIAGYFMLEGLQLDLIFPAVRRGRVKSAPPSTEDPGIRGWIAYIAESLGLGLNNINGGPAVQVLEELRIPIDVQVTQDPSRLARIIGTLNGRSGLKVTRVGLDGFTLGPHLSPFTGEVVFEAARSLEQARVLGSSVELDDGKVYSLPAYIAIYLQAKGYGVVRGGEIVVRTDTSRGPL